jgi:hypothetical protein
MGKLSTVFRHAMYLSACFHRRGTLFQIINITVIHSDNQIELIEIIRTYRTGTVRQVVTPTGGMGTHPAVGQLSLMIGKNTCRVDNELIFTPCLFYQMPHHPFRRRRAANVAQANK